MTDINLLLDRFSAIATDPRRQMKKYLEQGRKVIGYLPPYTPRPLLEAAGLAPLGLWGGQISPVKAGRYAPISTCSIMRSCLELGMNGVYDQLSAVVMPILCDTLRGMSNLWREGVPLIPLIPYIYPQNRGNDQARQLLIGELRSVAQRLEDAVGQSVGGQALIRSMEEANRHNALMRRFSAATNDHLDVITPTRRHQVMKSAHFMLTSEHSQLVEELLDALNQRPVYEWAGKKVILTGITAEPDGLLQLMAEFDVAVVGDDLAQESRQYRADYPADGTAWERLAEQWFLFHGCSTVHDQDSWDRGKMLVGMAREQKADAIVVCLMQFCDVEEYEYPYISRFTEEAGLRSLYLGIDQSIGSNEQARTLLQGFAEM